VEGRHLGGPAIHPAVAAGGHKHDAAIGQIARLDVVARAIGELFEPGSVEVDFIEVIAIGAAFAIGKQDLSRVVVDRRIAHAALGIV